MASSYSPLKVELIGTGEQAGTWGTTTNTNLGTTLEEAITGRATATFPSDANYTLPYLDSNSSQVFRNLVLNVTSSGNLSTTRDLIIPAIEKQYIVENNTSGGQSIRIKTAAGTGVTIPNGKIANVYCDGANTRFADDFVDINGGTIDGTPIGSVTPSTGAFTTLTVTTPTFTTPLPVASGGTGAATFTANAVLLGNGTSALQVVAPGTSGNLLTSNGTTWQSTALTAVNKVNITAPATSATLTIANGKTFTASNTLTLAGTDSTTMTFPGTNQTIAGLAVSNQVFTTAQTFRTASAIRSEAASTQDAVVIAGRAGGTSSYAVTVTPTTLSANRTTTLPNSDTIVPIASQQLTFSGPSAARTITLPDANFTAARTDAAQTFTGTQTFGTVSASTVSASTVSATALSVNSNNISAVNSLGFRNRIINGNMLLNQRYGADPVIATPNTAPFVTDRWILGAGPVNITAQTSTTVTPTGEGFNHSTFLTNGTGASPPSGVATYFAQNIEGFNVVDLAFGTASAKSVTISFWVRSSITGTYSLRLASINDGRSYVATYSITSANTFQFKTVTIPGDTTGTWNITENRGLQLLFDLGSGSNFDGTSGSWQSGNRTRTSGSVTWCATTGATFYLTGVQLEAGTVATPFERVDFSTQLIRCQRYYNILTPLVVNANMYTDVVFPVGMRTNAPSITINNGNVSVYATSSRGAYFFSGITTNFYALVSDEIA